MSITRLEQRIMKAVLPVSRCSMAPSGDRRRRSVCDDEGVYLADGFTDSSMSPATTQTLVGPAAPLDDRSTCIRCCIQDCIRNSGNRGGRMPLPRTKTMIRKNRATRLRRPPRQSAASREPRGEAVYKTLKERILTLHLRPAERISEIQVAKELGVSRTPAREALRRLEQEGWLVLVPRQGYSVRAYSLAEVNHVYDLRIAIERHAARAAAERAPHVSLARLAEE